MAHIVLVDDNSVILEAVSLVLQDRGHSVSTFETAAEALRAIQGGPPPDLVITDLDLGYGESGVDLVREVDTWSGGNVPVVVLSGMGNEDDFMQAYAAGARDFLCKPVAPDELLAKCSVHLNKARTGSGPGALRDAPSGIVEGRFRIGRQVGQGSFGSVYSARDLVTGRPVALKFLAEGADDREGHARFLRETYAVSLVRSPNVIDVSFVGVADGVPFFAMEWVAGQTLEDRVHDRGVATREETLGLLRGLTRALVALRHADLVHRDLKPANVMLRDGRFDEPVLIDFGLAKRSFDRSLTQSGCVLGTPGYIAPEVVRGQDADHQSDLFGLGAVVRFALCGDHPFPGLQGYRLIEAMASEPISIPADADTDLRELLEALLHPETDVRPATADAVLDRISVLQLNSLSRSV